MTPRLTFLAIALASATASANTVATDGAYATSDDDRPALRRVEGRIGWLVGGSDVGDADGFSMGLSLGVGYRIGDLTLRGTVDHYRTGDSNDEGGGSGMTTRRGRGTRVGGALRYSFANTGEQRGSGGLGADFWGEVGLGLEHVAWRQGGVLDRPSASLAVGYELDGQGERGKHGRRRHIGYFMAFRTFVAQGPEMDGPAVCGGPCSQATKPSRTDLSMFFELGLHWGR
ncbi:MAG: hypothetical protein JNL83_22720 [Myxococcales bacterium]|nr:hypothetical protein [Myxococcales bacterium]